MAEIFLQFLARFGHNSASDVSQNLLIDRSSVRRYAATAVLHLGEYRYAPHNDVSVNDGPYIRRWTHNIVILQYLPLCYNCLQYSVQ